MILMTGAVCSRIHLDKTIFPSMFDYYKNKVGYSVLEESYLKRFSVFQDMSRAPLRSILEKPIRKTEESGAASSPLQHQVGAGLAPLPTGNIVAEGGIK